MEPLDRFLGDQGVQSARYVDDLYVFLQNADAAEGLLRDLIPLLRSYDLVLNESKCVILPKSALISEEPDLEHLFEDAVDEISNQVEDGEFDADYGFQSEWEEEGEGEVSNLELEATKILFDSIAEYPGHEESIERFCLPLFAKAGSDYATSHVMDAFKKRPSMSQIYASYLSKFLEDDEVRLFLVGLIPDAAITDWQKIWVLAALMSAEPLGDGPIKLTMDLLKDANSHDALRAVAAIYIGRHGDLVRRKALSAIYPSVSSYVQVAIYFSSRNWPGVERSNAKANWGGNGPLNQLLTTAIAHK